MKKIESLQLLRALAFLGIFLCHAKSPIHWAPLGVSVFFVLSGFLMFYNYKDVSFGLSVKEHLLFAINRIKKIYGLHILTMGLSVILILYYDFTISFKGIISILLKVIAHIFLIQTWIPVISIANSLNGVSWFLSVSLFLYFIFPRLKKFINDKPLPWLIGLGGV